MLGSPRAERTTALPARVFDIAAPPGGRGTRSLPPLLPHPPLLPLSPKARAAQFCGGKGASFEFRLAFKGTGVNCLDFPRLLLGFNRKLGPPRTS